MNSAAVQVKSGAGREQAKKEFLGRNRIWIEMLKELPADASFRRYSRIEGEPSMLLMDSPAAHEPVAEFADLADFLNDRSIKAPTVYDRDDANGFLLIEDFGYHTFAQMLADGADERKLYELAIKSLARMHEDAAALQAPCSDYNFEVFVKEAAKIVNWYWPVVKGAPCPDAVKAEFVQAWRQVFDSLPRADVSFVHRDFHCDNLMFVEGQDDYKQCGWIDFQDGLIGPTAYDVATLLHNERRDITPELRDHLLQFYFNLRAAKLDREAFNQWMVVMTAQRQSKVLGIFYRLLIRDGKDGYLKHQPRVARVLNEALQDPIMAPVRAWWEKHLDGKAIAAEKIDLPLLRRMGLDDTLSLA